MLRSDRRTSARTGPAAVSSGITAADVGRALRQERNRQGLSLRDVGGRTGIPQDQLRAAETGAFDRPDGLAALKTVRRYADLLGLPGDRFALAILEQWPTRGRGAVTGHAPGSGAVALGGGAAARGAAGAGAVAVVDTRPTAAYQALASTGPSSSDPSSSEHGSAPGDVTAAVGAVGAVGAGGAVEHRSGVLVDDRLTAAVPAFSDWADWRPSPVDSPYITDAFSDTGVTSAIEGADVFRPRREVPFFVKSLIVLVGLCVLAGLALIAVDRLRPVWLHEIGLLKGTAGATAAATAPPAHHHAAVATSALSLRTTSPNQAVVDVTSPYTVKVSAVGGPCWAQVSKAGSTSPLFAGIVQPGAPQTFASSGTVTVDLGSTSGSFSLTSKSGQLAPYRPSAAPFRIVVNGS